MEPLRWMRLSAASGWMDWSRSGVPPLPFIMELPLAEAACEVAGSVVDKSFSAMARGVQFNSLRGMFVLFL